jgi:predicted RNA-binding protein (virulence factor B family)
MLEIGRFNTLKIAALDREGARFASPQGDILLPAREVPAGAKIGDRLRVFVHHGSGATLAATLRTPLAQVGEFALLKVAQVSQVGAFLDWGLDKDLLVPFSEQPERMQLGRRYLVKLCLDNRGRIVGTARIDQCLEPDPTGLKDGDAIELQIREFTDLGAKVIVNDRYGGLLYRDELRSGMKRGGRLAGFVKRVREDGKIDVTLRRVGVEGIEEAKRTILAELDRTGELPLHDESPPEAIRERLGMSKKTFKKAVGGLYKAGNIELNPTGIRRKKP